MNYYVGLAFESLVSAMAPEVQDSLSGKIARVRLEISEAECNEDHCDHYDMIESGPIERRVSEKLHKLRSGVYDEERHGDLRETLEELEGLL